MSAFMKAQTTLETDNLAQASMIHWQMHGFINT